MKSLTLLFSIAFTATNANYDFRQSQNEIYNDRNKHATGWDMISARYISFISNTYLGNLIRDSHDAYKMLT